MWRGLPALVGIIGPSAPLAVIVPAAEEALIAIVLVLRRIGVIAGNQLILRVRNLAVGLAAEMLDKALRRVGGRAFGSEKSLK